MMSMHPSHALLLASNHHDELVQRAELFRMSRGTPTARDHPDCLIPAAMQAPPACRPDPRRAAARSSTRQRPPRRSLMDLVLRPHR